MTGLSCLSRISTAPILCLLLISCANSPRATEPATLAAFVRPPCDPGAELMATPQALPTIGDISMREAFARWIDDMKAYQDLRLQTQRLQEFVSTQCR